MNTLQFRAYAFDDVVGGRMIDTSTCVGGPWLSIINKLNKLENVKADMETGLVSMWKDGNWHILCASEVSFIDFNGELVVDYEAMRIGVVIHGKVNYTIFGRGCLDNSFTLKKIEINSINTVEYLGINDDDTDQYVEFPPVVYSVGDVYFNADCDRISTGTMFRQNPHIKSFQNLHMICDGLVFTEYQSVHVADGLVYIGDKPGYKFFADEPEEHGTLINDEEKIELISIYKCKVNLDDNTTQFVYRGYIINNDGKYMGNIFEFQNIWLGLAHTGFEQLAPFKLNSGQKTKSALSAGTFE